MHAHVKLLMALCHLTLHPRAHASVLLQLSPQLPANVVFDTVAESDQHLSCVVLGLTTQVQPLAPLPVQHPLQHVVLVVLLQKVPAQEETMSGYVKTVPGGCYVTLVAATARRILTCSSQALHAYFHHSTIYFSCRSSRIVSGSSAYVATVVMTALFLRMKQLASTLQGGLPCCFLPFFSDQVFHLRARE